MSSFPLQRILVPSFSGSSSSRTLCDPAGGGGGGDDDDDGDDYVEVGDYVEQI